MFEDNIAETIETSERMQNEKNINENVESAEFYEDAKKYWSKIPATIDGMLGGFGYISETDIRGSRQFLYSLFKLDKPPDKNSALDCGSGIGRISKNLLIPIFTHVDMVDQNPNFISNSKTYLGRLSHKIRKQFTQGLQDFVPQTNYYDIIWCQWVLGHLKEQDLLKFFSYCGSGLKENGLLIVKENVTSTDEEEIDTVDSSVTRPLHVLLQLFEKANLNCVRHVQQTNFPKGLYAVHMFALQPRTEPSEIKDSNDLEEKLSVIQITNSEVTS